MNIFGFLFYLGIINIVFGFLWKWVLLLPMAFILTITKLDFYGMRVVKIFGAYLLVSLVALTTIVALDSSPSGLSIVFYPLIGAFVLVMGFASNQYEGRKEAQQTRNWELMQMLDENSNFEAFVLIGAVVFYVFALFVPEVSLNGLTQFLFGVIDWAQNLPIIGLLLGIGGILFLLNTIFYGLISFGMIVAALFSKAKSEKPAEVVEAVVLETTEPQEQNNLPDTL